MGLQQWAALGVSSGGGLRVSWKERRDDLVRPHGAPGRIGRRSRELRQNNARGGM
jgi:hypothetical protein